MLLTKNSLLAQAFLHKISHALALVVAFTARLAAASGISRITSRLAPPPPPPPRSNMGQRIASLWVA